MDGIKEVKNSPLLNALPIWYHSIYTDGIHPDAHFPRDRYTKLVEISILELQRRYLVKIYY